MGSTFFRVSRKNMEWNFNKAKKIVTSFNLHSYLVEFEWDIPFGDYYINKLRLSEIRLYSIQIAVPPKSSAYEKIETKADSVILFIVHPSSIAFNLPMFGIPSHLFTILPIIDNVLYSSNVLSSIYMEPNFPINKINFWIEVFFFCSDREYCYFASNWSGTNSIIDFSFIIMYSEYK